MQANTPTEGAAMNYCPYCRYDLRPDTCANCGQVIGHLHCFCSGCGTPVPDDDEECDGKDSDCNGQVDDSKDATPSSVPTPKKAAKATKKEKSDLPIGMKRATCLLTDAQRDFLGRQAQEEGRSKFAQLGIYANAAIAALNLGRVLHPDITPTGEKGLHKMAYSLPIRHEATLRKAGGGSATSALRCYIEGLRQAEEKNSTP